MAHAATGGLRSPRTLAPFFPAAFASAFRASVNSSSGSWYRRSISTSRGGTPFIILDKEQWAIAKTEWQSVPLGANKVHKMVKFYMMGSCRDHLALDELVND